MAINRFSRPTQLATYKPMTFQELAFAPVQMRQREDRMADTQSEILAQANNMQFYDDYSEEANQIRQGVIDEVDQLTNDIQKNGATTEAVNRLQNLRNKYNTLVSSSGALGIASGIKQNIDSQYGAYMQYATQVAGQTPADAERNYQAELAKFKQGLPSKLNDFKGSMPAFSPSLAPKSIDYKVKIKGLVDLIGTVQDQIGKVNFQPVEDASGNIVGWRAFNHKNEVIENNDKIDSIIKIMTQEVLNPNSELGQDMKYKNISPEEMISMVQETANLPRSSQTSNVTSYAGMEQNPAMAGQGRQRTVAGGDGKDVVNLTKVQGTGKAPIKGTATVAEIDKQFEAIENGEIEFTDPAEKNRVINGLYHARLDRMAEMNSYADPESDTYDTFVSDMDRMIASSDLSLHGINTYQDYLNAKENPEILRQQAIATGNNAGDHERIPAQTQLNSLITPQIEKMREAAFANREGSGDMRVNNEIHTFGAGEADEKLTETFHKAINPTSLQGLAAIQAVEVAHGPMGQQSYEKASEDDLGALRDVLSKGMDSKEGAIFTFGGFSTGNEFQSPKLMYTLYQKDGKRMDFAIELRDNEFTDEILSHLENNLHSTDRDKVAAVRDNVKFGGVPVTSAALPARSFNDDSTLALQDYSNKVNAAISGAVQNKSNPRGINKALWDSLFIKPNDEDHDFAMVVNDDRSYSTVRKKKNSNEIEYYTIGDYVNKKLMTDLAIDYAGGANVDADYYNTPEGKRVYNEQIHNFFYGIIQSAGDISSRKNIASNALIYNDDDDTFANTIQSAYDVISDNSINTELRNVKLAQLFNDIKNKKLQTKRKVMGF